MDETVSRTEVRCMNLRISLGRQAEILDRILSDSKKMLGITVITPNIGHLRSLRIDPEYRKAMSNASLVLPDGWPIALLASGVGRRHQERVTGSDLIPKLLSVSKTEVMRIAILGIPQKYEATLRRYLDSNSRNVTLVYLHEMPEYQFLSFDELTKISKEIIESKPNLVISCFGSPNQEIFNENYLRSKGIGTVIGAGATFDFILGRQKRSPLILRKIGLEWLFRLLLDPKRLIFRYTSGTLEYLSLVGKHLIHKVRAR